MQDHVLNTTADRLLSNARRTDVIFRRWPKRAGGGILALFPGDPGTNDPHTCSSYAHVGQHGSADPRGVIAVTRPAHPSEWAPLYAELVRIGYSLNVVHRHTHAHLVRRRAVIGCAA